MRLTRLISILLASVILMTNAAPLTAYAIDRTAPVNDDGTAPYGNKSKDEIDRGISYVGDTPIRLSVSKTKKETGSHEGIAPKITAAPQTDTVTYKVSGRVDGAKSDLIGKYGNDKIELAYSGAGTYLGYGWLTGTKEYLEARKAEGTDLYCDIIYNKYGVFEGYAYVTNYMDTKDDDNRYVAGATMALYDSIEIFRNPDKTGTPYDYNTDQRFRGVTVIRDSSDNSVENVYINKGFAGTQSLYVLQKDDASLITVNKEGRVVEIDKNYDIQDAIDDMGSGVWTEKIVERGSAVYPTPPTGSETIGTPILYYSLANLHCTSNDTYSSSSIINAAKINEIYGNERISGDLYGFDRAGNVVNVTQYDEMDFSLFVFVAGETKPTFEIVGGKYADVKYNGIEKRFIVGKDTVIYHLDDAGCRDSMVDPQTGIAYIEQKTGTITEPRPNLYGDFQSYNDIPWMKTETGTQIYVWPVNVYYDTTGGGGNKTFEKILTTRIASFNADTENEYTTGTYDEAMKKVIKDMVPKLDKYGHAMYYSVSPSKYVKGSDIVDYDGDYLGYGYSDSLDSYNIDSYTINNHSNLYNGDEDNPFNQRTHYANVTMQDINVEIYNNHVISGNTKTPTPTREGYSFCGWLVEPSDIAAGYTSVAKAYWRVSGTPMDASEHEKWYEAHASEAGLGTVYTVTFDANGGLFTHGGDPHSTDKLLYRRLGDAYIMENVWVTGENTPNDPLDTRLVDSVENKAAGINTMTAGMNTANDPYTPGMDGGFADMLKRVPAGTYIMEELESPLGYKANALPVGVTVNENTTVQTTQMTDSIVRTEIVKKDAPEKNKYNYYVNGVQQKNAHDEPITKTESKGSFSYEHVKGATLKVEGRDSASADALSAWVQVTNNSNITKINDGGNWCFSFTTDAPFYIEGLPAGRYRVTETVIPTGYVTMQPQNIVVTDSDEVINLFGLSDDHTKVEVRKYYVEDGKELIMPNSYHAKMSLVDSSDLTVSEWYTDDASDYTGSVPTTYTSLFYRILAWLGIIPKPACFVDTFRAAVETNPNITTVSWDIERYAFKLEHSVPGDEFWLVSDGTVVECDGSIPISTPVPTGFAAAYASRDTSKDEFYYEINRTATKNTSKSTGLNDQIWDVTNGTQMHVSIYPKNDAGKYTADFKFNYVDNYTGSYSNTVSYDTVDGLHRFDYLPEGSYKLRELEAPIGFSIGNDKTITVQAISDIQEFKYENKKRELVIAKTATADGMTYYAGYHNGNVALTNDITKSAVMKGATIKVYYSATAVTDYVEAFKDGAVPTGAIPVDTFISGEDGKYVTDDYLKGDITEDQVGDLKPHVIKDIYVNGYYYVVEDNTPDYYKTMDAIEVMIKPSMTIEELTVRPVNLYQPLKVYVYKTDKDTHVPLRGAVFEVMNEETGAVVGTLMTDATGYGTLMITSGTGRLGADGKFIPYTFRMREITPPEGYELNSEEFVFTVDPAQHDGISKICNEYDARLSGGTFTIEDKVTELSVTKSDFTQLTNVSGAQLAIYEAAYVGGQWQSTGIQKDATWSWTSTLSKHTVQKLAAGKEYVLHEIKTPDGYTTAPDIFFKVSLSGKAVGKIWYDKTENPFIRFKEDAETGAVESVTISTKQVANTYLTITDVATMVETNIGSTTGTYVDLTDSLITNGKAYVLREIVHYNDGSEDIIEQISFVAHLTDGKQRIGISDKILSLSTHITNDADEEIFGITPDAATTEVEILNPLKTDHNGIDIVGSSAVYCGKDHGPLSEGKVIMYRITYVGSGKEIILAPSTQLQYTDTAELVYDPISDTYRYNTTAAAGDIYVQASLKAGASGSVDQKVYIDGISYSYKSAIAVNGGTPGSIWEHTSKLLINNDVKGTHPDNLTAVFKYTITLTKADGTPLDGGYAYVTTTAGSGALNCLGKDKEFTFSIIGDDYILICDLPYGTKYSVKQTKPTGEGFLTTIMGSTTGATGSTKITNVLYENERNAKGDREVFIRNNRYAVTNKLHFESEAPMDVDKYAFTLDEDCLVEELSVIDRKIESWFSKTDVATGEELAGATCVIYDEYGSVVTDASGNDLRWISGTKPKEFSGTLKPGKYRFHEELAPDGYGYADDTWFEIGDDGTLINRAIIADKMTEAAVLKVNELGSPQEGAVLQILNEDKSPVTAPRDSLPDAEGNILFHKGDKLIFTSKLTGVDITGMLNADKKYYLHEITPIAGYKLCTADVAFTIPHDGSRISVSMTNLPTKARFMKTDSEGNPIAGAKLEVRNATTGEVVIAPWLSASGWVENTGILSVDTWYELVELVSPDGYHMASSIKFKLDDTGEIEIKMADDPIYVKLVKYDMNSPGNKLCGGTFQVLNSDKSVFIDTFLINEEVTLDPNTYKLAAGKTYYFHEVTAPSGYITAGDVEFTIPYYKTKDVIEVAMRDPKYTPPSPPGDSYKVHIYKYDGISMEGLPEAEFTIYDTSGKTVMVVKTGADGKVSAELDSEKYTIKETKAPAGYILDTEKVYEIDLIGHHSASVSVPNYPFEPIRIRKVDALTGKGLAGAKLEIVSDKPESVFVGLTDADGYISFMPPYYGSFAVRELEAPTGYLLDPEYYITFEVSKAGVTGNFIFRNTPTGKGKITARYDADAEGKAHGWVDRYGVWHSYPRPKLGDRFPLLALQITLAMALLIAGAAGFVIFKKRSRKEKEE